MWLYLEQNIDPNVQHFQEKLRDAHGIQLSYKFGENTFAKSRVCEEA